MIVPNSLWLEMKKLLHTWHLGIVKIKNRAWEIIYWPGINSDIENIVNSCKVCQEYRNKQSNEPIINHKIPTISWTKVGTDILRLWGKPYLIIVDYTNFFDISQLPNKLSSTVITHTKHCFQNAVFSKK